MPEKVQRTKPDLPDLSVGLDLSSFSKPRKRRLDLSYKQGNNNTNNGVMDWPDAVTSQTVWQCVLPWDWVWGTDLAFCLAILQTNVAAAPNVVLNSQISAEVVNTAYATGLTFSDINLENISGIVYAVQQNETVELVRLIPAATVMAIITRTDYDYRLGWIVARQGGHASDTLNAAVLRFRSAWLEYYSTYDYQNRISD